MTWQVIIQERSVWCWESSGGHLARMTGNWIWESCKMSVYKVKPSKLPGCAVKAESGGGSRSNGQGRPVEESLPAPAWVGLCVPVAKGEAVEATTWVSDRACGGGSLEALSKMQTSPEGSIEMEGHGLLQARGEPVGLLQPSISRLRGRLVKVRNAPVEQMAPARFPLPESRTLDSAHSFPPQEF